MDCKLHQEIISILVNVLEHSLRDNRTEIITDDDLIFYAEKAYGVNHPNLVLNINEEDKQVQVGGYMLNIGYVSNNTRRQEADRYEKFNTILLAYINELKVPKYIPSYYARYHFVNMIKNYYGYL